MTAGRVHSSDLDDYVAECDRLGGPQHPNCAAFLSDFELVLDTKVDQTIDPFSHHMLELASERRRFGYRRLHILLKREGVEVNWKKLYRLYKEERLTVRKRGGRKRALGTRAPMAIPQGPNQRWSLDFVSDFLTDGRRFRVLCVIDDFSRECLATVVDNSISGTRVSRELDRIVEHRGIPCMVVSDNGTELTSNAILKWQQERQVEWHYIAPGKPMQNGFVESFKYFTQQLAVYREMSGRDLDQEVGEQAAVDVETNSMSANPVNSCDIKNISLHTKTIATVLSLANIPPNAKIL